MENPCSDWQTSYHSRRVDPGVASALNDTVTPIPGTSDLTFEELVWPGIKVAGGKSSFVRPGKLTVRGVDISGVPIRTKGGRTAGTVSATGDTIVLPPGEYAVRIWHAWRPFTIVGGPRPRSRQ
jgi:hypothetical protein